MIFRNKIPVTIVTGFLGSGKTTFINNLLQQNRNVKIVVVENEFGDVSVDSHLIASNNPQSILELSNGCICCSLFNEFSLALQELVKQSNSFDQLIIETTGVADPEPIIQPFFQDADLLRLFEFRGTVCIVDAMSFQEEIGQFEQLKQIVLADLLLLNKVSNSHQEKLSSIRQKLRALNNTALLIETDFAKIDMAQLNLLHEQIQNEFIRKLRKPIFSESEKKSFHSFTLRFGNVDEASFRDWFAYFVSYWRSKIFRIKGLVIFDNSPVYWIVQAVGGTFYITEGSIINPFENAENVLVFIGNDISKFEIEKMLDEFLYPEAN